MAWGRRNGGVMVRETLLALLVLALVFLNFGHVSISTAGTFSVTPDSWCGDPLLPDQPGHLPCHACRIGGSADLPPAPAGVEPVAFAATRISYGACASIAAIATWRPVGNPRAPPLV